MPSKSDLLLDIPQSITSGPATDPTGAVAGVARGIRDSIAKEVARRVILLEERVEELQKEIEQASDERQYSTPFITLPTLVARADNYQIAIHDEQSYLIDASAPFGFTGIVANYGGQRVSFTNTGANIITFTNQDINSLAANRIITGTGAGIAVAQDQMIHLRYDDITTRWRVQ